MGSGIVYIREGTLLHSCIFSTSSPQAISEFCRDCHRVGARGLAQPPLILPGALAHTETHTRVFNVTVANPVGPNSLARAGTRAGSALEEVAKDKDTTCDGTYRATVPTKPNQFTWLCLHAGTTLQELGTLEAGADDDYLEANDLK